MPETPQSTSPSPNLLARTYQQAQSELPQPKITPPWEEEPTLPSTPTTKIGKAYEAAKNWLSEHEQHLSEKVLQPFRNGLDLMAEDLQNAGESGHTKSGGQLTEPTRALASGVGTLLKAAPVGKNVSETLQANIVPPELEELGVQLHPEQIVKDAGLVYKGELTKGSGVHMFEHPEHPGMTASLHESEFTPEAVQKKIQSKMDDFGVSLKPKQVAKNASGESAASQEAINRSASEKSQGKQRVRIDSRSLKETPLIGADAVDAKVGDFDHIAIRNPDGSYTILDSGPKARPLSGQPKSAGAEPKISAKPAQKLSVSKEDSKLAENYVAELLKKSKD